jgi:hypothetical protein
VLEQSTQAAVVVAVLQLLQTKLAAQAVQA